MKCPKKRWQIWKQDYQQDKGILVIDDDLLLLDNEDEDTEEYDWKNEPPVEDFGNLDIDWVIDNDNCISRKWMV